MARKKEGPPKTTFIIVANWFGFVFLGPAMLAIDVIALTIFIAFKFVPAFAKRFHDHEVVAKAEREAEDFDGVPTAAADALARVRAAATL